MRRSPRPSRLAARSVDPVREAGTGGEILQGGEAVAVCGLRDGPGQILRPGYVSAQLSPSRSLRSGHDVAGWALGRESGPTSSSNASPTPSAVRRQGTQPATSFGRCWVADPKAGAFFPVARAPNSLKGVPRYVVSRSVCSRAAGCWRASPTISARDRALSLARMCETWVWTVWRDSHSSAAMSGLDCPRAIR